MALHLGEIAPDFTQDSTAGTIRFHEWIGTSWCILFSHPKEFTPVCTTELGTVARLMGEFTKRNCKVVALSVDSVADHKRWVGDIQETQGQSIDYPILGDPDRKVATLYDMIHPKANDTFTVRSVFILDPSKKIRLILTYPASAGRNFTELLRVLDSLQLTDKYKVATPADWKDGQDVIIVPAVTNDEAKKLFPKGFKELKPYLRFTPQPNR